MFGLAVFEIHAANTYGANKAYRLLVKVRIAAVHTTSTLTHAACTLSSRRVYGLVLTVLPPRLRHASHTAPKEDQF